MSIFYFKMQGLKEKQKKSEKLGALCRVYAHAKGPFGHFAVRIHTAKAPRGGHLCIAQPTGCVCLGLCRASSSRAHDNEQRHSPRQSSAHGNATTHDKAGRTAKDLTYDSG
jgi:hypothetical protein